MTDVSRDIKSGSQGRLRVAIFATMPANAYSGGRYYALMLAEALSEGGHEVHLITNQIPLFFGDMNLNPGHKKIAVTLTRDFRSGLPEDDFDCVILVPAAALAGFYHRAEIFAIQRNAHLIFVNFESGDWFNSLSPSPRKLHEWAPWSRAVRYASVVLSISREGNQWARGFYRKHWRETVFDFCYPPVNTRAADAVSDVEREKRVLLFMRFSTSRHKGSDSIDQLFCEALRGYTLALILGKEEVPSSVYEKLLELSKKFDVKLEFLPRLSDVEKFREIKRARLVLFPSMFEGYGYPPVEALYCGTPCVAFRLPVLEETCGENLFFAVHGDWNSFRKQIELALNSPIDGDLLRAQVESIAPIRTATHKLEEISTRLSKEKSTLAGLRKSRLKSLRFQERWHLSDLRLRIRGKRTQLKEHALRFAGRVVRRLRSERPGSRRIIYYPAFETNDDLVNHWYRAKWYLPRVGGICEEVTFPVRSGVAIGTKPEYMTDAVSSTGHFRLVKRKLDWLFGLLFADLILIWEKGFESRVLRLFAKIGNISIVNVATNDLQSREYGAYCSLVWKYLTPSVDRELKLSQDQQRFRVIAERLKEQHPDRACVFGTGPSLEHATEFDYGCAIKIVCNSIVQNPTLMEYLNPQFICAGDVVSHLGVSLYADQFRKDLLKCLSEREVYFVTTAEFGSLLLHHFPEIEERVFLLSQTTDEPNYDLLVHYGAPRLDSTLNIHMLPLAATFSDEIWLLGCDGKSTVRSNEDFWAHAKQAQYHELVDTGHLCHPTFDVHRQQSTYDRFIRSTAVTIEVGEAKYGKQYISIMPSNIPALQTRAAPLNAMAEAGDGKPYELSKLRGKMPDRGRASGMEKLSLNGAERLPLLFGVSKCLIHHGRILHVAGWALAMPPVNRLEIWLNGQFLGNANLGFKRADVFQKHPAYGQTNCGFQFFWNLDDNSVSGEILLRIYSGDDMLREERVKARAG